MNEITISAFTPPTNGWIRAYNGKEITDKKFIEDFRTLKRYKEFKDCGFDEMLFAGETEYTGEEYETSDLKKMLDLCGKCNLKAIVYDKRILNLTVSAKEKIVGEVFETEKEFDFFLGYCIKDYKNHPAFAGVSIVDEPFISKKTVISDFSDGMKRVCPYAFVHTCFNPLFCVAGGAMQETAFGKGDTYEAFGNYIDAMSVPSLGYYGYDDYPFKFWCGYPLEPEFIRTMQFVVGRIKGKGLPFHFTIQSYAANTVDDKGNERKLGEADLNWQANLALSFGAKKLYYYTYWRFQTRSALVKPDVAIMDDDGTKILYDEAKNNNALIKKIFKFIGDYEYCKSELLGRDDDNAALKGVVSDNLGIISDYSAESPVLVNEMSNGEKKIYCLFNCRDPFVKTQNRVRLVLNSGKNEYSAIVKGEKKTLKAKNGELEYSFAPGEAIWLLER